MIYEGSKGRRVYDVARETENGMKYRQYSAHSTAIAWAAGINCYKLIYFSRATFKGQNRTIYVTWQYVHLNIREKVYSPILTS